MKFNFITLEVALQLADTLGPTLNALKSKNKDLADQAKRALQSTALNLAEGSRAQGGNKLRHFHIAAGSLEEALTALRLANSFGEIDPTTIPRIEPVVERLRQLLWRLTHPSSPTVPKPSE